MKKYSLMPSSCLICQFNGCAEGLGVCRNCVSYLQELLEEKCINCGKTANLCKCENPAKASFLFFYRSRVSKIVIHTMKNSGDPRLVSFVCELMISKSGLNLNDIDTVTFVPRSKRGKMKYGYDQAQIMAQCLSRLLKIPFACTMVRRREGQQKLLTAKERHETIKNRYIVSKKFLNQNSIPTSVLLTDDVCTTGITLNACRSALRSKYRFGITPLVAAMTNNKTNLLLGDKK